MAKTQTFLSKEDTKRVARISRESSQVPFAEAEEVLTNLLEKYPVNAIPVSDYPRKYQEAPKGQIHIAVAYMHVLDYLALKTTGEESGKFKKMLVDFFEREISHMEKVARPFGDHPLIADHILLFLGHSIIVYHSLNDWRKIGAAFRKFVTIAETMETPYFGPDSYKSGFLEFFSSTFNDYLKENGIDVFALHPRYMEAFATALSLANDEEPCLIIGETGTGKERIARAIHNFSKRRENVFHPVNVSGINQQLFGTEITGIKHGIATDVKAQLGAFLRAYRKEVKEKDRIIAKFGYLIENNRIMFRPLMGDVRDFPREVDLDTVGGTLFLDEIGTLDITFQPVLLRIIQEREVHVVGEDRPRKFNIKIVCAANDQIYQEIEDRKFRKDLFHRISKGMVKLPALREIEDAIPDLAMFQLSKLAEKMKYEGCISISRKAKALLKEYTWPGNIRELENVLYRAVKRLELERRKEIREEHLELGNDDSIRPIAKEGKRVSFKDIGLDELNENYARYLVEASEGKVSRASRLAKCGRSRIRTLFQKYGMVVK